MLKMFVWIYATGKCKSQMTGSSALPDQLRTGSCLQQPTENNKIINHYLAYLVYFFRAWLCLKDISSYHYKPRNLLYHITVEWNLTTRGHLRRLHCNNSIILTTKQVMSNWLWLILIFKFFYMYMYNIYCNTVYNRRMFFIILTTKHVMSNWLWLILIFKFFYVYMYNIHVYCNAAYNRRMFFHVSLSFCWLEHVYF